MPESKYSVVLEVEGPLAMWTRPDTGGTPTTYPAPTWSACKGLLESVARLSSGEAWINPTRVEICRRVGAAGGEIRYQRYTTNYGGPLRKSNQIRGGSSYQFFATVLSDVCYRIYGDVVGARRSARDGSNVRHYLQDLFDRRLRQGRCHRTPCLGWSEFTASYWGPPRDGRDGLPAVTEVDRSVTLTIPSMLVSVFDRPVNGRYDPVFRCCEIREGVLCYAQ